MTANGSFNIFWQGSVQPNRQQAAKMFSLIAADENGNQRLPARQTVSKRQTFRNEIRLKKNDQKRKVMRNELIKNLQSKSLLTLLQSLALKDNFESKTISNMITDLRRNIIDLDFCKQLNDQKQIKRYILNLYINHQIHLNMQQKCLLISCLTYLTFYHLNAFDLQQKQKLNDTMIKQISQINHYDWLSIQYLHKNIDLLTNIISDQDADINHYLLDTSLFSDIANKITQIATQGQQETQSHQNDEQLRKRYQQGLDDIRQAFISTLINLSYPEYANESFFEFAFGELVGDTNYLQKNGVSTLKILTNFFKTQKFRFRFIETEQLCQWFQKQVSTFCQQKFQHPHQNQPTNKFSSPHFTLQQRQIFFHFINCMLTFIHQQQNQEILSEFSLLIDFSLNSQCLSQFLIQCSQNDPTNRQLLRNSRYVSQAIRMYEFLADSLDYDLKQLLVVTSERNFQDIFKVLLDETFFTSHRISQETISLLNKILSKDPHLITTLNELGIFASIDSFLSQADGVQKPDQISNFFDLLTLMINSDSQIENGKKEKGKINCIAMRIEQMGFIPKIQNYQNHENRQVADRAEGFLEYLFTFLGNQEKHLLQI